MSSKGSLYAHVHNAMVPWILGVERYDLHGEPINDDLLKHWFYRMYPINLTKRYPNRTCLYEFVKIGKYEGTNTIILSWGGNYAEMKPNADGSGFKSFLHADFRSEEYPLGISDQNHATFEDMIAHAKSFPWK